MLVHGNPTWGYLYRNFIEPLKNAGYRVIVLDHLGFGRSEKPDNAKLYTKTRHAQRFEDFIESLILNNAVVVSHDWGGPISLLWAVKHSEKVAAMFFLNTGAYILKRREKKNLILKLLSLKLIGDVLVKGLDLFKKLFLFGAGITKHERISTIVKQAYYAPHPTWSSRTPVLAFPRKIPTKPNHKLADFFEILENGLILSYREKPVEIMWGMKDVA